MLFNLLRYRGDPRPFLLPANICPIVPVTFRKAGQPFRLVDVDERDLGIDRKACLQRLQSEPGGYAGVLYVRPYGALEDLSLFFRALRLVARDLLIVDDRCLCEPDVGGVSLTPDADMTLYSTGRAKPVDVGWGGFAHLRPRLGYSDAGTDFDPAALEEVERQYKLAIRTCRPFQGDGGAWLDTRPPITAWAEYRETVLAEQSLVSEHRRRLNRFYTERLPRSIQLPSQFQGWRFQIRTTEAQRLVDRLIVSGLFASRHYASLGRGIFDTGTFPIAEALAESVVNLFNDRHYDQRRAERTVEIVLEHVERHG